MKKLTLLLNIFLFLSAIGFAQTDPSVTSITVDNSTFAENGGGITEVNFFGVNQKSQRLVKLCQSIFNDFLLLGIYIIQHGGATHQGHC
mgnify:CR=1 FL=1